MSRRAPDYVQPSWSGSGLIEMRRGGERFPLRDLLLVPVGLLVFDAAFWGIGVFMLDRTRIVCGAHCYPDPHAIIHDVHLYFLLTAIPVALTLLASLLWRSARVATAVVQGVVVVVVLALALPSLHHADDQQARLNQCHYGYTGHCVGVRQLS